MNAQQPGTFDKKAFIAAVKAAIEAKSPKTLKEADDYKSSGKAGEVKGEVKGLVTEGKEGQTKDIEAATEAPAGPVEGACRSRSPRWDRSRPGRPCRSRRPAPCPSRLRPNSSTWPPASTRPTRRWPTPRSARTSSRSRTSLSSTGALADKKAAAEHADTAPGEFRQQEAQVLAQGKADARPRDGRRGGRDAEQQGCCAGEAGRGQGQGQDPRTRRSAPRSPPRSKGSSTPPRPTSRRSSTASTRWWRRSSARGRRPPERSSRTTSPAKMSAYKKDRYGGWLGPFRWARDKIKGMPDKVNEFYVAGRELYLQEMDKVISQVADIVGDNLTAAKQRIAAGRNEITDVREEPAEGPEEGRGGGARRRSATGSRSSRATSTPSRRRWSTRWPRSTSRRARVSTSGSRSCRPPTGA